MKLIGNYKIGLYYFIKINIEMIKKNKNNYIIYIILFLLILLCLYLSYINYNLKKNNKIKKNNNYNINKDLLIKKKKTNDNFLKINNLTKLFSENEEKNKNLDYELSNYKKNQENKICMSVSDFNKLNEKTSYTKENTINRDYRVLNDQLYPPLNRSDTNTHTNLANNIINRNMYIKTNDMGDTYRLVAYVTSNSAKKDTGNNSWKLFGRQKDRHLSEFYMTPTNNNNDVKIHIKDDMIVGDKLRDVYAIPNNITFNSPMLNTDKYEVVEVPKADLTRSADYL